MKNISIILLVTFVQFSLTVKAQIDSVIVEKYYISDTKDSTNLTGGKLAAGSVTYRVYIDLAPGSKLLKVFGDAEHPLRISSTASFFNHTTRGVLIGKDIESAKLYQNSTALDTWLTLGRATDEHSGVLKQEDTDGSMVGGSDNDGGSDRINGGLLVNTDPAAGIPLISADGLIPDNLKQDVKVQIGGRDLSNQDSTIFGSRKPPRQFFSNDFMMFNIPEGIAGTTSTNRILVAQLTTKGELSFALNVFIEDKDGTAVRYVAENPSGTEKTNRYLTYPLPPPDQPSCGCKDPDYLEFNKNFERHIQDSCKTKIVYGCTDINACNYNPRANFNIQSICCYPGKCNNRDIRVVCPDIGGTALSFDIYPNPADETVTLKIKNGNSRMVRCILYDANGTSVLTQNFETTGDSQHEMNISCLTKGFYIIRIYTDNESAFKPLIKK